MLKKPYTDKVASSNFVLEVTPELVQGWANLLGERLKSEFALPGQCVTLQIADNITLISHKDLSTKAFVTRLATLPNPVDEVVGIEPSDTDSAVFN